MALATCITPGTAPAIPRQIGAHPPTRSRSHSEPLDALAELLGYVKGWARHHRMADVVQAMDDAHALLRAGRIQSAGVHHG
ncbi:hypothetical protein GALL_338880 [mine drainage metagenome]|jgi:hypothetical protein|uniref:Uncharacterized protein n=1 Tax=mine drainage metagenome TaxID=410659 RepID=A0A1J5R3J5_9ZZZZ